MAKRMLIDTTHAEETRVVVLDGNRLEDFDVETQSRKQIKGNIYLAKIVRVEPSLQAAFVEYGGNRHGFLAFGEIHPDYYQIPVADRQRLLEMQEEEARFEDDEANDTFDSPADAPAAAPVTLEHEPLPPATDGGPDDAATQPLAVQSPARHERADLEAGAPPPPEPDQMVADTGPDLVPEVVEPMRPAEDMADGEATDEAHLDNTETDADLGSRVESAPAIDRPPPEMLGGEHDTEERPDRRSPPRFLRNYKIQEVIRRRQIVLVQVVKEERGTKGAALTTYISLAGRYCVLMPNSPRGGGISRKITSAADRRRLREVTTELQIPRGMGLIVRTAGANRPKAEIIRDCEYLLQLWDDIRDNTLKSIAPALIHEEANLIRRAVRDLYSRDVEEVVVAGEDGWRAARDYMRMLMPTHAKKVQLWREPQPLFSQANVESQLEAVLSPVVQLRSGGYLVIDQTEALVAIDVNSGRATRERNIEETAYRTNLEAADEVARQLRLRDLAGLIVIDFIDMENRRNAGAVERRLKDALREDRARIQLGSISHFGLLEMSRQRLRPSLAETSLSVCPHCGGSGRVRSTESAALHVLRQIEEEGARRRSAEIDVHINPGIVLYLLNNKRTRLAEIEAHAHMKICFRADENLTAAECRIERIRAHTYEPPPAPRQSIPDPIEADDVEDADVATLEADTETSSGESETGEEAERRRRRRRRRRRGAGPRADEGTAPMPDGTEQPDFDEIAFPTLPHPAPREDSASEAATSEEPAPHAPDGAETPSAEASETKPRARGRRGGRRRKPGEDEAPTNSPAPVAIPIAAYSGPTPADPFGASIDIFDALDAFEAAAPAPRPPVTTIPEQPAAAAPPPAISAPQAPQPEPEAAAEPVAGPVIEPIVIGAETATAQRKRGWWRR